MVSSFSPHRHHGDTSLFSPSTTTSPTHLLRHSPTSCSAFALTIPSSIRTRSASKRTTPTKPRAGSNSPAKLPLSLTSNNSMNSGGMTLRSGSCSPLSSPRDQTAQRRTSALCPDTTSNSTMLGRPGSTSPLKRSDGMMSGDDDASRGSPVAKRRSSHMGYYPSLSKQKPPVFGSPSFGTRSPPKRPAGLRKSTGHVLEKPSYVRSRPQARQQIDFSSASDTTARMRRVTSVENFLAPMHRDSPFATRTAPLPNASIHPHVHPLARSAAFGGAGGGANQLNDWMTPQNYKSAKPNIMAFHSTGFVPKRGRPLDTDKEHGPQPDTPCKRTTAFPGSAFQTKRIGARIPMGDLGSPRTPAPFGTSGGKALGRRDSFTSTDGDDLDASTQSSCDYELPPTPTKKTWNDFDDGSVFTVNKRARTSPVREKSRTPALARERWVDTVQASGPKTRANTPRFASPKTPRDNIIPPDPSSLSISGKVYKYDPLPSNRSSVTPLPVTPARDHPSLKWGTTSSPVFPDMTLTEDGMSLHSRFAEVKHIGTGQFSEVYRVTEKNGHSHGLFTPGRSSESGFSSSPVEREPRIPQVYAVKRAKNKFLGPRDRRERMLEVLILKELARHAHVVSYENHWIDEGGRLCIQTEFCEGGSLDKFLEQHGEKGRLDEFRVWKMLLELCMGVQYIHEMGFMHLDLKPGNVFITSEGSLKIGDFGMAMRCPAEFDVEKEGDRAYIAQEVLDRKPGQPGDIFSLGVCMIEIAGNEALPPYGPEWESLRKGDISVAPILSTSSSGEFVHRDDKGNPIVTELVEEFAPSVDVSSSIDQGPESPTPRRLGNRPRRGTLLHNPKPGHLAQPPRFMEENGLELLVKCMIAQDPEARPTATQLLQTEELRWVDERRRSPATIFEGLWGPRDMFDSVHDHSPAPRMRRLAEDDFEMDL